MAKSGERSALIKRVAMHFEGLARCSISVPEWGESEGEPLILYFTRWVPADWQKIRTKAVPGDEAGTMVNIIILKAEDEQGNKLFTLEDKPELLRQASSATVERIVKLISLDAEINVQAAEKK